MDYANMHNDQFESIARHSKDGKDFVGGIIQLDEDDLDGANDENIENFTGELEKIFERHSESIAGMLSALIGPGERGTAEGASLVVQAVEVYSLSDGLLHLDYEVPHYLGCKDANYVDEKDESIPFVIDPEERKITLTLQVPFFENPDPDYEEF